ncbi:MAG: MFS transporter [Gemmatimonadetes bacterium]|nr:MFS transporter [Gemmatimonadota bacterium]
MEERNERTHWWRGVSAAAHLAPQAGADRSVRLGLRANAEQFALLVLVNAFVGAVVGVERPLASLLAESEYGIASATAALSFLVAFGIAKAVSNLAAGGLADRLGRRRVLIAGWLAGAPVPLLLLLAPSWEWVIFANLLLGLNQGLAWSATVIMKMDLAGPKRRGLAMGLNEFAGYLGVAVAALAAGYLAGTIGPRGAAFGLASGAVALGLGLTLLFVRDTGAHVEAEERAAGTPGLGVRGSLAAGVVDASVKQRPLFAANQAGLVNNLNDGLAWGIFPLFFAARGVTVAQIGWLAALYPASWSLAQLVTGALSDRWGRRRFIVGGLLVQALALALVPATHGFGAWAGLAVLLGLGTAAVYPTLLAQVSDLVTPRQRASAVGVYRLWRDSGYVAGGVLAGVVSDLVGFSAAILVVAALTAASALVAAWGLSRVPSGGQAWRQ